MNTLSFEKGCFVLNNVVRNIWKSIYEWFQRTFEKMIVRAHF